MYLGFCATDISENSRFSLYNFPLKQTWVLLWLVSNYQHFSWTAMYILVRFSASRKWIFLEIHACLPTHITYMRYILVMFEQQLSELCRYNNISTGCIWASSGGIFMKICVLDPTNIQNTHKTKRLLRLVYDYICVPLIVNLNVYFLPSFFWKHSSYINSIDVTPSILRRWHIVCAACGTVWSRFGGVSVQQVALWWVCRHCVLVSRGN